MGETDPGAVSPGPDQGPRSVRRFKWLILSVASVVAIAGASLFVVTLPPALAIHVGSYVGTIRGDFPTISSNDSLRFSFNATTFANQTQGPPSTLTLQVAGYAYWLGNPFDHSHGALQTWLDVTATGHFASNIHPSQLDLSCNGTGPDTYADAWTSEEHGSNVSYDTNHQIGFHNSGGDTLPVTILGQGGAAPYHDFSFFTEIEMTQYSGYEAFVGLRATVTGWLLPPIGVGLLLQTVYAHRTATLFPQGQNWTLAPGESRAVQLGVYTAYTFSLRGSLAASSPFTAYVLDLPTYLALPTTGLPATWNWTSGPGVTSTSFNATFASEWGYITPYPWYLLLVNPDSHQSITVWVTQAITATT